MSIAILITKYKSIVYFAIHFSFCGEMYYIVLGLFCYAMLCYVMLCYAMLCCVMLF